MRSTPAPKAALLALLAVPRPRADEKIRCKGGSEGAIEIESSRRCQESDDDIRIVVGMDVHNADKVGRTGIVSVRLNRQRGFALEEQWKFDPEEGGHTYTGTAADAGRRYWQWLRWRVGLARGRHHQRPRVLRDLELLR